MSTSKSNYALESLFLEKFQEKYKLSERDIKRAFSHFDVDKNGLLSIEEIGKLFAHFLNGVRDSDIQALVQCYDVNGDGSIALEEFFAFLTSRSATAASKPSVASRVNKTMKGSGETVTDIPLKPAQFGNLIYCLV